VELTLKRYTATPTTTLGMLFRDDDPSPLCHTLEDVVRPAGAKVKGKTAIPAGRYEVIVNMSNRFKRLMCLLLDVKGFEGVRIHGGNTSKDSDGCIIVAKRRLNDDTVQGSMEQFVTGLVQKAINNGEKVFITIKDIK